MPFNESPDAPTIDWLGVKAIITSLHVSLHFVYGFTCPKDTYILYDLSVHFPKVNNLKVWLRMNRQAKQTLPPKIKPQRAGGALKNGGSSDIHDQLQPDGTANRVTPNQD